MGKLEQNQSHNIQALDSLKAQCVGVHMHMNSGFWLGTLFSFFSFFNISCLACFILKSLCSFYFCRHSVSKTGNEILSEIMKDAIKHCQEKKKKEETMFQCEIARLLPFLPKVFVNWIILLMSITRNS